MSYGQVMAGEEQQKVSSDRTIKKPGFFKRWIANMVRDAAVDQSDDRFTKGLRLNNNTISSMAAITADSTQVPDRDKSMRFNVWVANGGRIVETQRYDRLKDRNTSGLYIITNDQDFGREIDKIITMEALK